MGEGSKLDLLKFRSGSCFISYTAWRFMACPDFSRLLFISWDSPEGIGFQLLLLACCTSFSKVIFFSVDASATGIPFREASKV